MRQQRVWRALNRAFQSFASLWELWEHWDSLAFAQFLLFSATFHYSIVSMPQRLFTIAEANALLPTLRPLLAQLRRARQRIAEAEPALRPVLAQANTSNTGNRVASQMVFELERAEKLMLQLQTLGVEIKDLSTGLVDFPAEREGRVVYLCWRTDEPQVSHWHEVAAGFAGRQPL